MGNLCECKVSPFNYNQLLLSDNNLRSVEVKDEHPTPDCGLPRRHASFKDSLVTDPFPDFDNGKGCRTIWDSFRRGLQISPNDKCLGTRLYLTNEKGHEERGEYIWMTYNEVNEYSLSVAAGLHGECFFGLDFTFHIFAQIVILFEQWKNIFS